MKTIVAGSRDIYDYNLILKGIEDSGFDITEIVSGGYRGVDALGERWAKENLIKITQFKADWDTHGRSAGPIRNGQMAKYADALIAFCRDNSRGTTDMIKQAKRCNLKVYVVAVD